MQIESYSSITIIPIGLISSDALCVATNLVEIMQKHGKRESHENSAINYYISYCLTWYFVNEYSRNICALDRCER